MVARREALDRINVYPVADHDTGSNLATTLQRVSAGLRAMRSPSAAVVARTAADAALLGARGNSGAIFAQFLEGLAEGLKDSVRVAPEAFGRAVRLAAAAARGAMARPEEGTILSVIRDWAGWIDRRSETASDFAELVPGSLPAAAEALARTPDEMPLLKKAGVVDAGAQGFVHFLEGVARSLGRGRPGDPVAVTGEQVEARIRESRESILFRYCTEVLLEGERIDREALRRAAAPMGDSLAVVGGATRVRLHLHVNRPEEVFEVARRFGRVEETKVEDMRSQHLGRFAREGRVAIVTDSACDLPDAVLEKNSITVVPLRLMLGTETYLDRVTITPAEFHHRLAAERIVARTSQPPPADFREVYRALAAHGAPVLGIHVSSGLSGTFNAARTAAASLTGEPGLAEIVALDGKTVSVAQGLVVREAAHAAASGKSLSEVAEVARSAASRTRLVAAVPSLEFLVRGGRVTAAQGLLAKTLGLCPLLTVDAEGRAALGGASRGFPRACRKLVEKILGASGGGTAMFGVAHFEAPELAERVASELLRRRPGSDAFITECAPVLAAHAGPGAVAAAVLTERSA